MQENITGGYPKIHRKCKEPKNMYVEDGLVNPKFTNKQENITSYVGKHYKIFDLFPQFREVLDNSLEARPQAPMSATIYC